MERRSAFQPVIDALQIKPFLLDLSHQHVLIVEGIYDYYAFEMFKGNRNINVLPSVGADSIAYYISLMIAWRISYKALWDNDDAGRRAYERAKEVFGEDETNARCFMIPLKDNQKNRRLEGLFAVADLEAARCALGLPANAPFEKTIAAMFFSEDRAQILARFSTETRQNFEGLFACVGAG